MHKKDSNRFETFLHYIIKKKSRRKQNGIKKQYRVVKVPYKYIAPNETFSR